MQILKNKEHRRWRDIFKIKSKKQKIKTEFVFSNLTALKITIMMSKSW